MKKIITLFCFIASMHTAFSQAPDIATALQKIAEEKDENKKVDLIINTLYGWRGYDSSTSQMITMGQAMMKQGQEKKDLLLEASGYCELGFGFRMAGNSIKGLEYHQKALELAERAGNFSILAMTKNQMGHVYRDREDIEKALQVYASALPDAERAKNQMLAWPLMNMGSMYMRMGKLDSALKYLQRSYELVLKVDTLDLSYVLWNLGAVHSRLGNDALAITYYNMSVQKARDQNRVRNLCWAYTDMAEHFQRKNQPDSSKVYAKRAIEVVQNTTNFYLSMKPAKLLADMYEKSNCDSTLKYTGIYKTAGDSLFSEKANQQVQLMTFDEGLRQQEIAAEKLKAEDERKQNIQYALIALGIIILLTLYLLLSRSFITNTKLIEFFGVIALLIVFEFLNLLLHPFLERVTNHSPILMLLALVCIAALLVPLHHKVEKWATAKLVEKNKKIRLASAKKTIEELENK